MTMCLKKRQPFVSTGEWGQLVLLFFPILAVTFSNCVFTFVEKLFLARYSLEAMNASINAAYACQIFQATSLSLAMMAQVFVGRWYGAGEWKEIGPCIWQFIWLALITMVISIPISTIYGQWYFRDTNMENLALPYYYFLVVINFLFPLGAALSCFYLGQGKTRFVLFTTMGSQVIKVVLAYVLIFGWGEVIPSLGIMGGAVSTLITQGGLCLLLLLAFVNKKNAAIFHSRDWKFKSELFWECVHPGALRAVNRILCTICWASIARLMTAKGGDELFILSVGGTLFLFLPFLAEAICQTQTTIVSNLLGARNYHLLDKVFKRGTLLVFLTSFLFGIPFLIFPYEIFYNLFPAAELDLSIVNKVFFGVWVSFVFFTLGFFLISYTFAFKDTKFSLFMGIFNWVNGYLFMYVMLEMWHFPYDQFWLVLSGMHASTSLMYYWRMKWLQSKLMQQAQHKPVQGYALEPI